MERGYPGVLGVSLLPAGPGKCSRLLRAPGKWSSEQLVPNPSAFGQLWVGVEMGGIFPPFTGS